MLIQLIIVIFSLWSEKGIMERGMNERLKYMNTIVISHYNF